MMTQKDDDDAGRRIYDYTGSLTFMPNKPKTVTDIIDKSQRSNFSRPKPQTADMIFCQDGRFA